MRTLQQRILRHDNLSHLQRQSTLWTAGAVISILAVILILFFWAFGMRAF